MFEKGNKIKFIDYDNGNNIYNIIFNNGVFTFLRYNIVSSDFLFVKETGYQFKTKYCKLYEPRSPEHWI